MSEREAFEAWAFENGLQSHTNQSLDYPLGNVLWKCWQARAAVQANVPDGWRPIEAAPENMADPVVVFWIDREGEKHHDFDYTEDGCWMQWHNHAEHVEIIGGHGVSYTPPYTHWMPFPAAPGASAPPVAQPAGQHVPEVHFGNTMRPETLRSELQKKCSAWGAYWRGSDAHGVELTTEQAVELLQNALNVEVEIKDEEPEQAQPAERKPLAEEQIREAVTAAGMMFTHPDLNIARAIERAHGIGD